MKLVKIISFFYRNVIVILCGHWYVCDVSMVYDRSFFLQMYSTLDNECVVLARLVPRCSDPSTEVRQKAIACVELTLRIASRLEGEIFFHHLLF